MRTTIVNFVVWGALWACSEAEVATNSSREAASGAVTYKYAHLVAPENLTRKIYSGQDDGYPRDDPKSKGFFPGFYDVDGSGRFSNYCRIVGNTGATFLACSEDVDSVGEAAFRYHTKGLDQGNDGTLGIYTIDQKFYFCRSVGSDASKLQGACVGRIQDPRPNQIASVLGWDHKNQYQWIGTLILRRVLVDGETSQAFWRGKANYNADWVDSAPLKSCVEEFGVDSFWHDQGPSKSYCWKCPDGYKLNVLPAFDANNKCSTGIFGKQSRAIKMRLGFGLGGLGLKDPAKNKILVQPFTTTTKGKESTYNCGRYAAPTLINLGKNVLCSTACDQGYPSQLIDTPKGAIIVEKAFDEFSFENKDINCYSCPLGFMRNIDVADPFNSQACFRKK